MKNLDPSLFSDFYKDEGLQKIHSEFLQFLKGQSQDLYVRYQAFQEKNSDNSESEFLLILAPYVEVFLEDLFSLTSSNNSKILASDIALLFRIKRDFIQRHALRNYPSWENGKKPSCDFFKVGTIHEEIEFAQTLTTWLQSSDEHHEDLQKAAQYAAWALLTEEGRHQHAHGILFQVPQKLDFQNLISVPKSISEHAGFSLRDPGLCEAKAQDQAHYCILCHPQKKDFCSKGYSSKDPSSKFQKNALSITLSGCPLEQKISEAHTLKRQGLNIATLAMMMIDNPLLALTGHRICNECSKACIYQKQEPVDIPGVETQILKSVLKHPFGIEIYSLLSRWNPLNLSRPLPKGPTHKKILVVGAGPAGINLAHHLLQDGHSVVMIDGAKVTPWDIPFAPLHSWKNFSKDLEDRTIQGFGGVAEYGITPRWDKNFLTLARLLLERRSSFLLLGGVRFGGTLTEEQAFQDLGFDHIALCMGAGQPKILNIPKILAPGVRQASDFLMTLQLGGAYKKDSDTNLALRWPVIVIGGGLTAIDTATEAFYFYPRYVANVMKRYEALSPSEKDHYLRSLLPPERQAFREIEKHRDLFEEAKKKGKSIKQILKKLGGVKVFYRKSMQESPAYRLNAEELQHALNEGVEFLEYRTPLRLRTDVFGHVKGIYTRNQNGQEIYDSARSFLVATGTHPNTNILYDDPDFSFLEGEFFSPIDEYNHPITAEKSPKPEEAQVLLKKRADKKAVTFFGDMHPSFQGNVVKAMASAKRGYPTISKLVSELPAPPDPQFLDHVKHALIPAIHSVSYLAPSIVEIVVHAPQAAKNFKPGMFFRLQNFNAPLMEPLALTGASVDKEKGTVSLIILEMGHSSSLCSNLQKGEPVVLMGPTGEATEIPNNKNVLLVGGGLGNAVLFSIGQAMREKGCHVTYFAGYRTKESVFKREEIEKAADIIIWACDEGKITSTRPQDFSYVGNMVEALTHSQHLLKDIEHIVTIGSDGLMAAIAYTCHHTLKESFKKKPTVIGSINAPMQCMMKGVCAQCVQLHRDPENGKESYVFSCASQDQDLAKVDFGVLQGRLSQNGLQEKLYRKIEKKKKVQILYSISTHKNS